MKIKFECIILENEDCMIRITRLSEDPKQKWSVVVGYEPDHGMDCATVDLDSSYCNLKEFCKIYLEVHDWAISQLEEQRKMTGEIEV